MKIHIMPDYVPVEAVENLRYDSFRVNEEIKWIGIRVTLSPTFIFDDSEGDDYRYIKSLPVFAFITGYGRGSDSLIVEKTSNFI